MRSRAFSKVASVALSASIAMSAWVAMSLSPAPASSDAQLTGGIRGRVLQWATGRPVAGATVSLPGYGVRTTSRRDGSFSFPNSFPTDFPYRPTHAVVTAKGWGRWELRGAPLYAGDTLLLRAELTRRPWTRTVTPLRRGTRAAAGPPEVPLHTDTCTGWPHQRVPPPKIRVRITDRGVSRRYGFAFYVKHVLPHEWLPFWDGDALRAGAIAVKTYAAYRAMPGNAYSGGKGCADIRDDNYDQVFDPSWSTEATDQAVNATLGSILFREGGLFLSQYWNGHKGDPCAYVKKEYPGRMSQEGTYTCAVKKKMAWPRIVQVFYPRTRWKYLHQLLLNAGAESPAMYPWKASNSTSFLRTSGRAYKEHFYIRLRPQRRGDLASLYQARPFLGTKRTPYSARAAFRCYVTNKSDCRVRIKVTAMRRTGRPVVRERSIKVPNNGRWRLYRFDPRRHGKGHVELRLRLETRQKIAVDSAGLTRRD